MTDPARKTLPAAVSAALCAALALAAALPCQAASAPAASAAVDAPAADFGAGAGASKRAHHRRHRHAAAKAKESDVGGSEGASDRSDGSDRGDGRPAKAAKPGGSGPTVLGDSIGIGLSMASGAPRLAHEGVAIRSSAALAQLRRVPERSTIVLSLGTNDAVGSIRGVEGAVDRIVAIAEQNDLRVVWLGPPCVFKSWNTTAERLDALLKQKLGGGRVRYVSAADAQVCDRSLRAGDGVHFTMKGYAMLWKRVVAAEGDWAARPARDAAAGVSGRGPERTAANDR